MNRCWSRSLRTGLESVIFLSLLFASVTVAKRSFKVDRFVRQFRGRGDNFEQFWDKFMVLAAVQKWDSDEKKMDHLPLFLDGDAFLVYTRMSDTDKKKPAEVKKRMEQAFSVTKAQTYKLFTSRKLRIDESPDAYAADLQRLLKLSGHAVADDDADKDPVEVEQLLAGLPLEFARQLRMAFAGQEPSVSGCGERVHAL